MVLPLLTRSKWELGVYSSNLLFCKTLRFGRTPVALFQRGPAERSCGMVPFPRGRGFCACRAIERDYSE